MMRLFRSKPIDSILLALLAIIAVLLAIFGSAVAEGHAAQTRIIALTFFVPLGVWILSSNNGGVSQIPLTALVLSVGTVLLLQLIPLPLDLLPDTAVRRNIFRESQFWSDRSIDGAGRALLKFQSLSYTPLLTAKALGGLGLYAFLLTVWHSVSQRRFCCFSENVLYALSTAFCLAALAQSLNVPIGVPIWDFTNNNPSGLFSNSNHLATLMLMTLSMSAYRLTQPCGCGRNIPVHLSMVILGLLGLAVCKSLAGYGIALTLTVYILIIRFTRWRRFGPRRLLSIAIIIFFGFSWLYLVLGAFGFGQCVDFSGFGVSRTSRPIVWDRGLDIVREHWLFGIGAGAFTVSDNFYLASDTLSPEYVNELHSDMFSLSIELGLVGLLIITPSIVKISLSLWLYQARQSAYRLREDVFALPVLMVLLHSAVDYPVRTPFIFFIVLICLINLFPTERASP